MGEEHALDGSRGTTGQLRGDIWWKDRDRHTLHLRTAILSDGLLYGWKRRIAQGPCILRGRQAQTCGGLRLSIERGGRRSDEDGEERTFWKDSIEGLVIVS